MLTDQERDLAAFGKFDRVAEQIDQDLAHPRGIAQHHQMGKQLIAVVETQAARFGDGMHEIGQLLSKLRWVERLLHQLQFAGGQTFSRSEPAHARGLDLVHPRCIRADQQD